MEQFGVLVVDDSAFMRRAICQLLESDPRFLVTGIARDGEDAVEKALRLKPDIITMDVEMPKMNGLLAVKEINEQTDIPVVMLSSLTGEGAKETLLALEYGAVDFFLKDSLIRRNGQPGFIKEFYSRLAELAQSGKTPKDRTDKSDSLSKPIPKTAPDLLVIGSSTGGPSALKKLLPALPAEFPIAVIVAQHMPMGFTRHLAERLDSLSRLAVREACDGDEILPGTIYIAPSGFQTTVTGSIGERLAISVSPVEEEQHIYKPSIDRLLESAAPIYQDKLAAVILTGMGNDGTKGCRSVKQYNGTVFAESEQTCVVYGMPKSVVNAGLADGQYPLSRMAKEVVELVRR